MHRQRYRPVRGDGDLFARFDGQCCQSRRVGGIGSRTLRNPVAKNAVLIGITRKSQAPFVRHLHCRLEQNQTQVGIGQVQAPGVDTARQREKVVVGKLASQGEAKAPLAVGVAMTRPLVAPRPRQHSHHIVAKADISASDGRLAGTTCESDGEGETQHQV